LNLKLWSKQYNKSLVLHLIVAPQLGGSRQHNYSTKTRQAGHANEQSMYSLMSMFDTACGVLYTFKFLAELKQSKQPSYIRCLWFGKFWDIRVHAFENKYLQKSF
jgi:hypothetical protein